MYSASDIGVDKVVPVGRIDKGLGFDFSAIADFVKTAATTGLGIYKQQATIAQTKALAASNPYAMLQNPNGMVNPNQYGLYNSIATLPMAQPYMPTMNVPQPYGQPSSGIDTTTMLMIGGLIVGGAVLFKMLR